MSASLSAEPTKLFSLSKEFANPDNQDLAHGSLRQLVFQGDRLVGHWTYNDGRSPIGSGTLWLQNYAGYHHPDFGMRFNNVEAALARAEKILEEWAENDDRPTWTC